LNEFSYRFRNHRRGDQALQRPLVQHSEQQDKEAIVIKCGNCHGTNGAWLLAAHAAADFAKLPQIIPGSMLDENKLSTYNCAKGTDTFSIKIQTRVVVEQRGAVATGIRLCG
jgi:hypothetical protein